MTCGALAPWATPVWHDVVKVMPAMELRHLHHLTMLAETGSIHRAARQLGLRQPALSQSIRALEADVGVQLVARNAWGSSLTPAGTVFLSEIRCALAVLERATRIARAVADGGAVPMRLGITSDSATSYFSNRLHAFMEGSDFDVFVSSNSSSNLLAMLDREMLDIVLLPLEAVRDNVIAEPLWVEDINIALAENHPLSVEENIDIRQLSKELLVVGSPGHAGTADALLLAAGHALGLKLHVTAPLPSQEVRLALVSAGLGVAVQPVSNIFMPLAGIVTRPLVPRLTLRIVAACPTAGLTLPARRFIEAMRLVTVPSP